MELPISYDLGDLNVILELWAGMWEMTTIDTSRLAF